MLPSALLDFAMVEQHASAISTYGAMLIPPLLQTRAYARAAAFANPQVSELAVDTVADAVTARQAMTIEARSAAVDVVVTTDALDRRVGGREVMGKQLHRLLEFADPRAYPWVSSKVLTTPSGPPPLGDSGGLALLQFKALPGLGAVYLEGPDGGRCLHEQDAAAAYDDAFYATQQAALPLIESRHLLKDLAADC